MELSKIDVEADSLPANLSETLPLLRGLCAKSLEIKTKLTTTLSKPSFHDIIPSSMSGKGNCKITKEYLAESIISLINMVDAVAPIVNTVQNHQFCTLALHRVLVRKTLNLSTHT